MATLTLELPGEIQKEIERLVREGWFESAEELAIAGIADYVGSRSCLGDSPAMLHSFAADALNESKPETALRFADRAVSLLTSQKAPDLVLYQALTELRVQVLLVLDRAPDALAALEEAREMIPNNPAVNSWIERLRR
jgi:hypothetical protein